MKILESKFNGVIRIIEREEIDIYDVKLPDHELHCCYFYFDKRKRTFQKLKNATYYEQNLAIELQRRILNYRIDKVEGWNEFDIVKN